MRIYLETTVPNFLFADDAPEKKQITEVFFQWLQVCAHELCVSPLVESEIEDAPEPKRSWLKSALRSLPLTNLTIPLEAEDLAEAYLDGGAIPRRYEDDAFHVAIAVCQRVDVLVSWNLKHLVNPQRVERINRINQRRGYPPIRLQTPAEVMGL